MEEILRQLSVLLRGMWLYRWWGLLVAWIVGPIAAVTIYLLPDRYESSARVYVDTQSILRPLMSGLAVQPNVDQQINMLSRTLISRPNVEKLIRMADLDITAQSKEEREALIQRVSKALEIRVAGRDNLYTLAYTDTNPERAKRVVQSLVSMFVESGLGDKRKDSDSARKFIEDQIKSYEQKLEEAENRLKEYKLRNLATVGGGQDYFGKMTAAKEQLEQARLALSEAENSRDALKRQLVGEEPVFLPDNPSSSALATVSVPDLDGRIDTLKKSLDGLLQRYTDQHPDVVGARKMIETLEAQKLQEINARRKAASSSGAVQTAPSLVSNPVFQQLKLSLADAEANVASIKARVVEYESRVQSLMASSRMLPQIEAEFTQLNRDYDINKRNYEALVSRRESAVMAVEMGATSGIADFRLIDPPAVPSKPSAPNRPLLMPLAGLGALLIGAALAFLISQIRPVFSDPQVLRDVTGLAVLGSVSVTADPARERTLRRARIVFLACLGAFVSLFAALTVWLTLARLA
ncbi:XrtA system polysaccharide chain length determinant [Zoogloea sp.]|uniref:XrtA system polysaccharide chain length determinant n=1 Tax=Zoogloea sp. TaxID=49181 RepID=UPI0026253291|nr:XrtA system polysaccharide chain length determinant [Zoogloea sp.]MDD3352533.1 GNVR domain-containing protein [Zoogloea sp.]